MTLNSTQLSNTKDKNSKIKVQNKTQPLRKSYTFLSKAGTLREHMNINNNTTTNNSDNNKKTNNDKKASDYAFNGCSLVQLKNK